MYYFKTSSLLIITLSLSILAFAQESNRQEHLPQMLNHYIAVKDALTKDDIETAQTHLSGLKKEISENDKMNNHAVHPDAMIKAVSRAEKAGDIKELRIVFKEISDHMAQILEDHGYGEYTLYLQYCPMAAGGEGAHWISDQIKIVNPYMGQKMPGCGELKQELSSDR